ncbi:hypothetical protein NIASO_07540 [Niabella soli DSM 19437]|uniref:Uncharacterized protein n=1 Tax=Niabella soli DSM 19437 TaxID=929713 RepID=W0F7K1_9BACT|nr:hypothetical protein NIASO_07540 [Niabella soli DSM 19437]
MTGLQVAGYKFQVTGSGYSLLIVDASWIL